MGLTTLSRLPLWRDLLWEDPDAAGLIGKISATDPVTLTQVILTGNKTVEFGPERGGFTVWRGRPLEARTKETSPANTIRLLTTELATEDRHYQGQTAVVALRPGSADWFGWSRFKTVTKRPDLQIQRLLDAAATTSGSKETALWATFSSMQTDPFGNEDTLYARFRLMDRTDSLAPPDQYYDAAEQQTVSGTKANRAVQDPELAFGICEDFEACRTAVEISQPIAEALGEARNGQARDHRGNPLPLGPTAMSLAREVMAAAIVKALAGGSPEEMAALANDRTCREAGSVAVWARRIFEDDIRNLQRRNSDERCIVFKPEALPRVQAEAAAAAGIFSRADVRKLVNEASAEVKAIKYIGQQVVAALIQQLDPSGEDSPERSSRIRRACIRAAALDASGHELPDNLVERLHSLRTEFPLFIEAALGSGTDEP